MSVHPYVQRGYAETNSEFLTAKSWMILGDEGPFPDVIAEELLACEHREMCDNMFNMPWLDNCRKVVDTASFIKSCKIDYCEVPTQETLEEIYETFIEDCKLELPDEPATCVWRTELGFDSCPSGKEWSGCKPQCDVKNCDPNFVCQQSITEAGCFCSDGLFDFDGKCLEICPNRVCSEEIMLEENRISPSSNYNMKIATVEYQSQFVHQVDIKFASLATGDMWQNIIIAYDPELVSDDNDLIRRCGRREPSIFVVKDSVSKSTGSLGAGKHLLISQCHNTDLDQLIDESENNYFFETELTSAGITVGQYQTWIFGQRRNPISGEFELFIQIDDMMLRTWPNNEPHNFGQMEIWLGKTKEEQWKSADFHIRNYLFHTSPYYQDIAYCTTDSWAAWSECTVTCGGGSRSREGLLKGRAATETEDCNPDLCPNSKLTFQIIL